MFLLDSSAFSCVMEVIHAPILLAKNRNHIVVNLVMRTGFPIRFAMAPANVALIVPLPMITEILLLENQPIVVCGNQNKTIRVLSKEYFKVDLIRYFPPFVQERG